MSSQFSVRAENAAPYVHQASTVVYNVSSYGVTGAVCGLPVVAALLARRPEMFARVARTLYGVAGVSTVTALGSFTTAAATANFANRAMRSRQQNS